LCRLGQWYYKGEGKQLYQSTPAYQRLEVPHAEVHQFGVASINAHQNNRQHEAIESLSKMENASNKVMELLNSLQQDILKQINSASISQGKSRSDSIDLF